MKERKIRLVTIEDAKNFVTRAIKCDFDIDIYCNRIIIDAKSILGILSLDLTKVLTVQLHGSDEDFEAYLDTISAVENKIA
ncbi:MAG: HPr family phosphocarrier protein [Clostridiales bacterium]|nr:HPr family phosphocarrier protein [Clostridiales bacterium]